LLIQKDLMEGHAEIFGFRGRASRIIRQARISGRLGVLGDTIMEVDSKPQITTQDKPRVDEKAQHTA
jgi:hypothetical protein